MEAAFTPHRTLAGPATARDILAAYNAVRSSKLTPASFVLKWHSPTVSAPLYWLAGRVDNWYERLYGVSCTLDTGTLTVTLTFGHGS